MPFNKPTALGNELTYLEQAIRSDHLSGDGYFSKRCEALINEIVLAQSTLLVHSCTAALEMAAILCDIKPGDEVIMPSYTFVSTANAVVLRGGVPVFVDIRRDTLNIDETLIEAAITNRTKAVIVVHYAGVVCAMEEIMAICKSYNLFLIEDAAQALGSSYKGRSAGSFGDLSCFSFHETKNVISGEGGCLCINNPDLIERAEIIREKGTNRKSFFKGSVDKYTWVDIGSSYVVSELVSAYLLAQLESVHEIHERRKILWLNYYRELSGIFDVSCVPLYNGIQHNYHIFYILLDSEVSRDKLIFNLRDVGINAPFHYLPLDRSPAGLLYGKVSGKLTNTHDISSRLVRLPLYLTMTLEEQEIVISKVKSIL
ncbi:dTDP-4-amino-4,6-dideoxygalactose transaminase [Vibrio cholerae]|nr:dTDP-4-amino-4,6-dideoxygalactose transaminase [Vibrio cholerae]